MARSSSRRALDSYRADPQQSTDSAPRRPSSWSSGSGRYGGWGARTPSYGDTAGDYRLRGWSMPPAYARSAGERFGPWSAVLLWGLLDTLSRPGHAEFFHHHYDDPGYRAWRTEADEQARNNPELGQKLHDLDSHLAALEGQPRNPGYLPPDVDQPEESSSFPALLLIAVCVLVVYLGWRYLSGDIAKGKKTMLGHSQRTPYRPKWFRVGMTVPVDPSLFILAESCTSVRSPEAATASGLISVSSLGVALSDGLSWHRLYLSATSFFQVHLDEQGNPDECRYFSLLDEITPADQDEWGFWLDRTEGMIGWPEFQTKDGKIYQRVWTPGGGQRSAPREIDEIVETAEGSRNRRQQAMLYARETGATAPAPKTEYLLASAIEQDGAAWVAIHVGIDVSISALQLS